MAHPTITVEQFFKDHGTALHLRLLSEGVDLKRIIREPTVNRPGLALSGFTQYFAYKRVQVFGNAEVYYLRSLTQEQREAIRQRGGPVEIENDETQKVYVIIDGDLHHRAMQALEEHDARSAIRAGLDDLEAGRVISFADFDARLRTKLGLPSRGS